MAKTRHDPRFDKTLLSILKPHITKKKYKLGIVSSKKPLRPPASSSRSSKVCLLSKSLDSRARGDLGVTSRDSDTSRRLSPSFSPNGLTAKSCKWSAQIYADYTSGRHSKCPTALKIYVHHLYLRWGKCDITSVTLSRWVITGRPAVTLTGLFCRV